MSGITIGRFARLGGVSVETVRFYERKGLLPAPPRRVSGYRDYSPESVERLRFIRGARRLGFSLGEIRDLLAFDVTTAHGREAARRCAEKKVSEVERRIDDLRRARRMLRTLAKSYAATGPLKGCPLTAALKAGEAPRRRG